MEELNKIRLKLAKANDANENTNNSGKDYMTIRDSLTDISLLLCNVERAVGECSNEDSGLNIPVVIASLLKATDADMLRVGKHDDGEVYALKLTESQNYYYPWDEEEIDLA